jgi:excinuclease ABC subunit C
MLKRIVPDQQSKQILETITGDQIHLRNNFGQNSEVIEDLMKTARQNALIYLDRQRLGHRLNPMEENNLFLAVSELQKVLKLNKLPRRIECYDISHLSGKFVYGSMVTFIDGRSSKKFYRLFRCPDKNNDFENHQQVLTRRLKRHLDNPEDTGWALPDLIIVDGGKGQLAADNRVLLDLNLTQRIEIVSIAKREEEIFTLPLLEKQKEIYQNVNYGREGGILLPQLSRGLVQRCRDEAHRLAITNNRKARLKEAHKSALDDLEGVGPKTKQKILQVFGSFPEFITTISENKALVAESLGDALTEKILRQLRL